MENIFYKILQKIQGGARFSIDFEHRSLRVNGKLFIKNGISDYHITSLLCGGDISGLERYYNSYRHSIPSERSRSRRKTYFQALDEKDLSDYDMMWGLHREECRFMLEYAILAGIITECITWEHFKDDNPKTGWFWQSSQFPSFIILKKWITND